MSLEAIAPILFNIRINSVEPLHESTISGEVELNICDCRQTQQHVCSKSVGALGFWLHLTVWVSKQFIFQIIESVWRDQRIKRKLTEQSYMLSSFYAKIKCICECNHSLKHSHSYLWMNAFGVSRYVMHYIATSCVN